MFDNLKKRFSKTQEEKKLEKIKVLYVRMTTEFHKEKTELKNIYQEIEKYLAAKDKLSKEKLGFFDKILKEKQEEYQKQLDEVISLGTKFNVRLKEMKNFYDLNNSNNYIGSRDSSFMVEFKLEEKYYNPFKPKQENVIKNTPQPKKKLNNTDYGLGI